MLQYLKEILGMAAEEKAWSEVELLPLYLRNGRKYSVLSVEGAELLLIYMEAASFNLTAFQKQWKKLSEYWSGDPVLCFEKLTTYQRKALIEKRISFVVPGSQVYLPCLGVALQERVAAERKVVSKLSPASQSLLLYLLYRGGVTPLKKVELANRLGVSAMNITRAVQELASIRLVETQKVGRSDLVLPVGSGAALYEKAKPYLIDPVQKRVFVKRKHELDALPLSGESALAERTMLNPPLVACRAIDRRAYKQYQESGLELVDPAWYSGADYIELEVWKYDPGLLAEDGMVDVVSLAASLVNNQDERIEIAVEEMVEEHKW